MTHIYESRASTIMYNVLTTRADSRPWLLPANICPIVPITFLKARVPFEFVDISGATLHMDLGRAEERIKTRKFGGLLYAHTYGEASTPRDFFMSMKQRAPEILIVDDRCLCVPDFETDTLADLTLYSTRYAKIVELNFGGYAFARDDLAYRPSCLPFDLQDTQELEEDYRKSVVARQVFHYRDSNWLETDTPTRTWHNYRRQIEIGSENALSQRTGLNAVYVKLLPEEIQLPHAYQRWRFNVRIKQKARVLNAIVEAGLFASSHYASLAGIMAEGYAPEAEGLADQVINLFNDHHFDVEKAERTCNVILENYEG